MLVFCRPDFKGGISLLIAECKGFGILLVKAKDQEEISIMKWVMSSKAVMESLCGQFIQENIK